MSQHSGQWIYWASVLVFCLFTSGCSSTAVIDHTPTQSLNLIKYVVTRQIPRGVRVTSPNGRQFTSHYFSPSAGFNEDATDKRERAFAEVLILGDRRPYTTEVNVYRERRTERGYRRSGSDKNLARALAMKIQDELAKSREERNIIDDFRAF